MTTQQRLQIVGFGLLGVLAMLLLLLAFGQPVPRWVFVALILAQTLLRVLRNTSATPSKIQPRDLLAVVFSVFVCVLLLTSP